jgi:hypothetical protein
VTPDELLAWAISNSDPANLVALAVIYHRLNRRLSAVRETVQEEIEEEGSSGPS